MIWSSISLLEYAYFSKECLLILTMIVCSVVLAQVELLVWFRQTGQNATHLLFG